ncbi:MAG: DUF2490 domain-containing protein [Pseudomonadota bacterium]
MIAVLLATKSALALEQESQTWITTRFLAPLGEHSDVGFRFRTRFSGVFKERSLYQYQFTTAHYLRDNLRIEGGYEQFRSRDQRLEDRWLGQVQLRNFWGGGLFRHRVRLELRDLVALDDPVYRLRYLLAHRRPISETGRYIELRNEVFVSLSEKGGLERGIVQNRIGATLGQRFGDRWRAEFRYQWGYIDSSLITRGDHLLQLNLIWDGR